MLTGCSALVLAACGGDQTDVERRTDTLPTIERSVANRLAARSEKVAALLERGDACGAAAEAARLRADATASINAIPDLYVEDFSGLVNEIQAQIPPCQPPEDDRKEDNDKDKDKDNGNGKGKGKDKGKKKGKNGDDG